MKKFAGRAQKIKTDVIGLDVHKDVIAWSHLDAEGVEVGHGTVESEGGQVLEVIRTAVAGREVHVAMEASGGMLWLYDLLVVALEARHVHVAQPRRIRAIANSRQKNDANDAYWLAYFLSEGRLPEALIPTGTVREMRVAVRARAEAVKQRVRAIQLLRGYLRQAGVRLPGIRFDGEAAQAQLRTLCATTSGMLGLALRETLARYDAADHAEQRWDEAIESLGKEMPEVAQVRRHVPGVGPTLSAMIVAESGPMERFTTPKAYAKYTGLTPSDRSTGGRTIHGSMTREGSRHLRWALCQAVVCCLRGSREPGSGARGAVARWVDAKERHMGSKAKTRVAAARKLATAIWWLFHRPKEFDACKPFRSRSGQPLTA